MMTHKEHKELEMRLKYATPIFFGCLAVAMGLVAIFINHLN